MYYSLMSDAQEIDLQPLLDSQQNKLNTIMSAGASIDAKALGLFAAVTTVLIFIAQAQLNLAELAWIAILAPLFGSIILTIFALYPRQYILTSADLDKHPEFYAMPKEVLILQLLADTQYAIEKNGAFNQIRWRYCVLAFLGALFGTFVLLSLLLIQ